MENTYLLNFFSRKKASLKIWNLEEKPTWKSCLIWLKMRAWEREEPPEKSLIESKSLEKALACTQMMMLSSLLSLKKEALPSKSLLMRTNLWWKISLRSHLTFWRRNLIIWRSLLKELSIMKVSISMWKYAGTIWFLINKALKWEYYHIKG